MKRLPFSFGLFCFFLIFYWVREWEGGKKEEWKAGEGEEYKGFENLTYHSNGCVVSLCTGRQGAGWEGVAPDHLAAAWTASIVSVPEAGQVTGWLSHHHSVSYLWICTADHRRNVKRCHRPAGVQSP